MRIFVAVFPPREVQRDLIRAARTIPADAFRLTAPERVHLTLRFLGETPPELLPRITSSLEPMSRHEPFEATTSHFGVFPSARRAKILWSGIAEGAEQLASLAHTAGALLEPEGFAREARPFVPHLTLGRSRRPVFLDPTTADHPEHRFAVRKVHLVHSKPTGAGVTYETLAEYGLQLVSRPGSAGQHLN